MNRSKFLAVVALVVVVGGLLATQLGSDDDGDNGGEQTATPAATGDTDTAGDDTASDDGDQTASQATDDADAGADGEAPATIEVVDPPPILDPKPELTNIEGWLQTDATSLEDFAGQVRIVEFWTFGCFNCKNRLPYTQDLYEQYHPEGLEIIGVHAPEFDFERDPERIAQAAEDLGVVWPIALDTEKTNFRAWQGNRRFWPRVYVLDQDGQVRYDHIGEGDYDGLEETVAYLIENGP